MNSDWWLVGSGSITSHQPRVTSHRLSEAVELFEQPKKGKPSRRAPLADRMRPQTVEEFAGQTHLLDEGRVLRLALDRGEIPSMILWGPPGSGKTTLAYLIAERTRAVFVPFSAAIAGIKEIKGDGKAEGVDPAIGGLPTLVGRRRRKSII